MDPESSFELVLRAQAGDSSALDLLLTRYRTRLKRWASGRLPQYAREITDTDDLVQDALLGTFKNLPAFENKGEWAFQAYLRRAVANRVRDELRRFEARPIRHELSDGLPAAEQSPLEAAIGRQAFQKYEAALEGLAGLEREAVIARLELGCSYDEIAMLLERPSADAARMMVARAVGKVAQAMAAHQD